MMDDRKPLMTLEELLAHGFFVCLFSKNPLLYMISCGGNLFFTVCGPSLYTRWGSLVFAVPKLFRHHAASPKENPCRSGSPWCKVRRKSLLWLTWPPCVAWYLELQWELLLVVHILNADSHKLHLMGKADNCSILDAERSHPALPAAVTLSRFTYYGDGSF